MCKFCEGLGGNIVSKCSEEFNYPYSKHDVEFLEYDISYSSGDKSFSLNVWAKSHPEKSSEAESCCIIIKYCPFCGNKCIATE